MRRIDTCLASALCAIALSVPCGAQEWTVNLYLQQSFPKQTQTNQQIAEINQTFGASFEDWSDITNLSVGTQLLRRLSERWKIGLELDYSRGEISGHSTISTEAGPADLAFRQRYSTYSDLLLAAHFLPCPGCGSGQPFVLLAAGLGYEKDRTTLALRNDFLDESLRVDNDSTFPLYTVGVGVDFAMTSSRKVFLQLGSAYVWARSVKRVPAYGSLAPAPTVTADTDSSGPNVWVGVSWRIGDGR